MSACAESGRSARSGATALRMIGDHGLSGMRGGSSWTASHTLLRLVRSRRPASLTISARTTPTANRSARASTAWPRRCSGAM